MPLEHIVIAYIRQSNWLNVLMLKSMDILQPYTSLLPLEKRIEVSPFGFRWVEEHLEQRVVLNEIFELNSNVEDPSLMNHAEESSIEVTFGLSLKRINHHALEQFTVNVEVENLQLKVDENELSALYCSQCANEIVQTRIFKSVRSFPILTMRPETCFNSRNPRAICPRDEDLYYGLNYIVFSPRVLGTRGILYFSHSTGCSVVCGRCRQLLGEVLGDGVAIQLFADTIRASRFMSFQLKELFDHVSPSQVMLRLLHDAVPINTEKTRLFLKCIRPDGQQHYLLMMDIRPVHLFRSKICLTDDLEQPAETPINLTDSSSEGSQDTETSSTSSGKKNDRRSGGHRPAKRQRSVPTKSINYVALRGYRGCRVKYFFLSTDEELANSPDNVQEWLNHGTLMLRISYVMLMELVNELNSNEQLVASLEKQSPVQIKIDAPRLSYILFKNDEDF